MSSAREERHDEGSPASVKLRFKRIVAGWILASVSYSWMQGNPTFHSNRPDCMSKGTVVRELRESNGLSGSPGALRDRTREDGCLLFRSIIDGEAVAEVRRDILGICQEAGWLAAGSEPGAGIAAPDIAHVEPEPAFMEVYNRVMCLESFHALAHQPRLLEIFDSILGEPTLAHARNIARIIFPNNVQFTTPAHQDFVHVQGTEDTWTAWIPLGDCPRELGGLAVLPGSHRAGIQPTHKAYGAGGLGIDTGSLPFEWATTDFRGGDALLFHSLTIHKALPNLSPNRIRLSVDFRYQGISKPVTQASFQPHHGQLSWDQVYADWESARYQYYWKKQPLSFVDWSPRYRESRVG